MIISAMSAGGAENGRPEVGNPENDRPNCTKNGPDSGLPFSVAPSSRGLADKCARLAKSAFCRWSHSLAAYTETNDRFHRQLQTHFVFLVINQFIKQQGAKGHLQVASYNIKSCIRKDTLQFTQSLVYSTVKDNCY